MKANEKSPSKVEVVKEGQPVVVDDNAELFDPQTKEKAVPAAETAVLVRNVKFHDNGDTCAV